MSGAARWMLLLCLFSEAMAGAQPGPQRAVVLARFPGPPTSGLFEVDIATGTVSPLGSFTTQNLLPLAVTWDPVNRDVLLALQDPGGTLIVRLGFAGSTVVRERILGIVPSTITDLEVAPGGTLCFVTDGPMGALWIMPRNGGVPIPLLPLPHATALDLPYGGPTAFVVQSPPAADPILSILGLPSGTLFGSYVVPGLAGRRILGVVDFPTALIRQGLSDDQGNLHRFESLSLVMPWPVQPPLPPGGTVELELGFGGDVVILGGASSPYLWSIPIFGTNLTAVAGPLPGDPVDFALTDFGGAALVRFGTSCAGAGSFAWSGLPQIGSASFSLALQGGLPLMPALLAFGLSDQAWGAAPLPLLLPGGCLLHISLDAWFWTATSTQGYASFPVPVPNDPALQGAIVFAQWGLATATGFLTSDAVAAYLAY